MLTAKDLMTTGVITVKRDTPVLEALELMLQHNISGMPVVEDDMTLAGIVSEKDVLRLFNSAEDVENAVVNDFMTEPAVHFDQDESFEDVCRCLVETFFRRVPVTNNGKVVGVISRLDIINHILKTKGNARSRPAQNGQVTP